MRRFKWVRLAIVTIVVAGGASWIGSAPSAQGGNDGGDPNGVISSDQAVDPGAQDAVQALWQENGYNADPMPLPTIALNDARNHIPPAQSLAAGRPGPLYAAYSDRHGRKHVQRGSFANDTAPFTLDDIEPQAGTYPFSYTRYRVFPDTPSTYGAYPYRAIGKLLFTVPGQGRFVCSASVVTSLNASVVFTAGHCVYTQGIGFHTDFLFVPARRATVGQFGSWTAFTAFTLTGWANGLFEYDQGALVMNRGGNLNRHVADDVGALNFLANGDRQQHWHVTGYPAAPQSPPSPGPTFDGEHQETCATVWATNDLPTGGVADPPTIGVGCDESGGTSGGPDIANFNGLSTFNGAIFNMLNGVNSYRYAGGPPDNLRLYFAYFGQGAIALLEAAENIDVF
jgi:V8-like Glu-specific endopeptidase